MIFHRGEPSRERWRFFILEEIDTGSRREIHRGVVDESEREIIFEERSSEEITEARSRRRDHGGVEERSSSKRDHEERSRRRDHGEIVEAWRRDHLQGEITEESRRAKDTRIDSVERHRQLIPARRGHRRFSRREITSISSRENMR